MPFIGAAIGAIVSAVGAVGTFLGGLGFVGQALLGIGLNVASTLIQRAFAKKPEQQPGGVQFERQYGADVPRQVACGLVGIAGHDSYINTYGSSNKYLQQLYTLSDYPSDGLSRVAINGQWATLGAVDGSGYQAVTSGEYANLISIKFIDGRQAAADTALVSNANPAERWTAAHIGVGITAVLVSMTYDKEKNAQLPDFFFEFRGARLYDWRKDSTVGGSGAHRWNDPAMHEFTENPIVIEYNYRRGLSVNGDLFCGMEMPAGDLPLDKWTAAANICDETAGGEARYRCSIILDCSATHGANIESLMLSCGGMTVDGVDGSWPLVGSDQPIVATITDDDLITTAPVRFRAKRSMAELVNSVSGNFPNPDELWSMVGYDPQISAGHVVIDRRTRDLNIDFPQVRSSRQAAQLAGIYLEENRYEASATITVRPRFQVIEPGDWITWASARYGTRTWIVTEATLASLSSEGPRNVQLSLQERDGSIYDGVISPVIVLPTPPGAPTYLAEVQDFTLVAVSVSGDAGRLIPAIRAAWSSIEDETVTAIQIEYWPTAQPESVIARTVPVGITVALLIEGVVSDTEYTVRTKLVTDPLRVTAWSAGDTVTTVDIPAADVDYEAIREFVDDSTEWIRGGTRELIDQLLTVALQAANQDLANFSDKQTLRREIVSTRDGITASYKEEITAATGPGSALATRVATLEVALPDLATLTITDALTARVSTAEGSIASQGSAITAIQNELPGKASASAVTALDTRVTSVEGVNSSQATALTAVEALANGISASANFRASVYAGPSGYSSRIGLEARVGGSGAYRSAALFIDVPASAASPTRIALVAQQTVVTTSAGVVSALFDGDTAFLDNARIRNLDATNITAAKIDAAELLQNGTLIEDLIAAGAVTGAVDEAYNGAVANMSEGDWGDVLTLSIASPSGHPVMFYYNVDVSVTTNTVSGSSYSGHVGARILKNGVLFRGPWEEDASGESSQRTLHALNDQLIMDAVGVGTVIYKIQAYGGAVVTPANANVSMIAQVNKK